MNPPPYSHSSDECSDGKLCFAFVTACAGENDDSPSLARPVSSTSSQEYSFGIANTNTQWESGGVTEDGGEGEVSGEDGVRSEGNPDWHAKWGGQYRSSSSRTMLSSLVVVVFTSTIASVLL